jgi:hypothetical protein
MPQSKLRGVSIPNPILRGLFRLLSTVKHQRKTDNSFKREILITFLGCGTGTAIPFWIVADELPSKMQQRQSETP